MRCEFSTSEKIIFGNGVSKEIGEHAAVLGSHALLLVNQGGADPSSIKSSLEHAKIKTRILAVKGEPTVQLVEVGIKDARASGCDLVIGFGGGSAIDAAKAIAVLARNPGEVLDYLEVIGRGQALTRPGWPAIAIPTTAGTGAEVTRNAVLSSPEQRIKVSLRSSYLLPRLALVDPELTISLPPAVTAATGMDALTQVIEPFVSKRASMLVDPLCREAMARGVKALKRAYRDGADLQAREEMSLVSLFSGMALANAGLGAVHGFASLIGGMFEAPHGAICARLLPEVMRINIKALQARQPQDEKLSRYQEAARILTGVPAATLEDGIEMVRDLCLELDIPGLGVYGITAGDISTLVTQAPGTSSMKANPIVLTGDEMQEILERSL
jgi:alcohol dehydrogenase class IV